MAIAVKGSVRRAWEVFLLQEASFVLQHQQHRLLNERAVGNQSCKFCHNDRRLVSSSDNSVNVRNAAGEEMKQSLDAVGHRQGGGGGGGTRHMDSRYWRFRFRTLEPLVVVGRNVEQPSRGYRWNSSSVVAVNAALEGLEEEATLEYEYFAAQEAQESEESEAEMEQPISKQWHIDKLCPTSMRLRRIKERDYDNIIEREKKLKIVLRIKDILLKQQPEWSMTLLELGKHRDDIGLPGKKRFIAFLKTFPAIFQVVELREPGLLPWFHLTPEAEAICRQECTIREQMQDELIVKLRKLLMMSSTRKLSLAKIAHIAKDLGLPADFRKGLVYEYPQYFRVVKNPDTIPGCEEDPLLELVEWSEQLAVTAADKKLQQCMEESSSEVMPRLEIRLPKRYRLSNKDKWVVYKFHELEAPTPYEDASKLHPASAEAEKRAVLTVQEVLSLTLEKRILVDHLTHFRKEFKFSNQLRGMIIRHPEHFYVSRKGARDTVFLRDEFEGMHVPGQRQDCVLRDKHPLVLVKEKFATLMQVKQRNAPVTDVQTPVTGS